MSDAGFTTFFGDRFDRIALSLPKIFGPLGPDVARAFKDRVQWIELSGGEMQRVSIGTCNRGWRHLNGCSGAGPPAFGSGSARATDRFHSRVS